MKLTHHTIEQIRQSARSGFYLRRVYGPGPCKLLAFKPGERPQQILSDRRIDHFEKMHCAAMGIYEQECKRITA